ncbi:MAG: tetratricopeptide repeat protein [Proteobacteria bacterium]|nr:tetratricopeptide repeat protein [Pseudomonadota bacterium]
MSALPSRTRLAIARAAALLLLAGCLAPAAALAADAPPPPVVPPEYSLEARKAYAAALQEARHLAEQKEYALALNRLDALAVDHPREPQARFLKATILTDQGKDGDAIDVLVALTSDFPELPEPHNNLAVLYAKKGQYDLARRELETAVAAAPDYAIARENLGDVYVRLAAMQFEKVATLDTNGKTAPAKLKLIRDALAVNANADAAEAARKAAALGPPKPAAEAPVAAKSPPPPASFVPATPTTPAAATSEPSTTTTVTPTAVPDTSAQPTSPKEKTE